MKYSRAGRGLAAALVLALGACTERSSVSEARPEPRFTTGGSALLVCPGGDGTAAEGAVSELGGIVGNGGHRLTLPAGAVWGETKFRVSVPASEYMEVNIKADGREGYSFARVVTATIDYSRCADSALPSTALSVWKIHPETKALLKRMPSLDDRLNKRVIFETDSLSSYSIAH